MFINTNKLQNKFNITELKFINTIRLQNVISKYIKSQNIVTKKLIRPHVLCDVAVVLYNDKKQKAFTICLVKIMLK